MVTIVLDVSLGEAEINYLNLVQGLPRVRELRGITYQDIV